MTLVYDTGPGQQGARLNTFLRGCGLTQGCLKSVKYQGGSFWVDGQPVHTDYRLRAGQRVEVRLPPEPASPVLPQPELPITAAYEDAFAFVADKPAGMAVHPTLNYGSGTLANAYLGLLQRRGEQGVFHAVNRIDKDTSGLVLCAKNAFAQPLLARNVHKMYLAIVQGELPLGPGSICQPLGRRGESIIGRCVTPEGQPSRTDYTVTAAGGGLSVVECVPVTGRTHQIRVHFSWLGFPLAGDDLYGGSRERISRQALHCARMDFLHPLNGQKITVESPLPPDMAALAEQCQNAKAL